MTSEIHLDDDRKSLLEESGHLLVIGGPGSGKTTIATLKAGRIFDDGLLLPEQRVIFLSFARPTVSRVFQSIQENKTYLSPDAKKHIQVETYHSFFWQILSAHGRLIGLPKVLRVMPKPEEAIALATIRERYPSQKQTEQQKVDLRREVNAELVRLAFEDGRICFDQFTAIAHKIVTSSPRLRSFLSDAYPFLILDEFQDTSEKHWDVMRLLGERSKLIALADPEQMIYAFNGASPERLDQFRDAFEPREFSFSGQNYRSKGTDIAQFGKDILAGKKVQNADYNDVHLMGFKSTKNADLTAVKSVTLTARKRLIASGKKDWSLAILVPTRKLMRQVSAAFTDEKFVKVSIPHSNAVAIEGAILSAYVIARLLQPSIDVVSTTTEVLTLLADFYRGKGGEKFTSGNFKMANQIDKSRAEIGDLKKSGKALRKNSISKKLSGLIETAIAFKPTGDPGEDWLAMRTILEESESAHFKDVAEAAKELRLLGKGTELRLALSDNWLREGFYSEALAVVRRSFVMEHFSKGVKPERGVIVMNMHKAKGKQFDEVIIFETGIKTYRTKSGEGRTGERILPLRANTEHDVQQARQNFHVSITRAKSRTTVLTCKDNVCEFLTGQTPTF